MNMHVAHRGLKVKVIGESQDRGSAHAVGPISVEGSSFYSCCAYSLYRSSGSDFLTWVQSIDYEVKVKPEI